MSESVSAVMNGMNGYVLMRAPPDDRAVLLWNKTLVKVMSAESVDDTAPPLV